MRRTLRRAASTNSVVGQPNLRSCFLDLPIEIRNIIYRYAINDVEYVYTFRETVRPDYYARNLINAHYPEILAVCKQIHAEASLIFYEQQPITAYFSYVMDQFVQDIVPEVVIGHSNVTKLYRHIVEDEVTDATVTTWPGQDAVSSRRAMPTWIRHIRHLDLVVHASFRHPGEDKDYLVPLITMLGAFVSRLMEGKPLLSCTVSVNVMPPLDAVMLVSTLSRLTVLKVPEMQQYCIDARMFKTLHPWSDADAPRVKALMMKTTPKLNPVADLEAFRKEYETLPRGAFSNYFHEEMIENCYNQLETCAGLPSCTSHRALAIADPEGHDLAFIRDREELDAALDEPDYGEIMVSLLEAKEKCGKRLASSRAAEATMGKLVRKMECLEEFREAGVARTMHIKKDMLRMGKTEHHWDWDAWSLQW